MRVGGEGPRPSKSSPTNLALRSQGLLGVVDAREHGSLLGGSRQKRCTCEELALRVPGMVSREQNAGGS